MTIHDEITTLQHYCHILRLRISNPRTCPRRAIETEAELAETLLKIAALQAQLPQP